MTFLALCICMGFGLNFLGRRRIIVRLVMFAIATCYLGSIVDRRLPPVSTPPPLAAPALDLHAMAAPALPVGAGALATTAMAEGGGARAAAAMGHGRGRRCSGRACHARGRRRSGRARHGRGWRRSGRAWPGLARHGV